MTNLAKEKNTDQILTGQDPQELSALATEINTHIRESEKHTADAVKYAGKAGEALLKAKKHIKHGKWMVWLEENCECSPRQAERYMKIAEYLSDPSNSTRATNLSQRKLLELIAEAQEKDSTPNATAEPPGSKMRDHKESSGENLPLNPCGDQKKKLAAQIASQQAGGSPKAPQPISESSLEKRESDDGLAASAEAQTMSSVNRVRSTPNKRMARYLTFEPGTPEVIALDKLEMEVRQAAGKRSHKLLTKAMKAKNLNAETVAAELLTRLAQRLLQAQNAS